MARRRKSKKQDETLLDIVEAKEQAQGFIERNQYLIIGVVAALVLIIGGLFAYNYLYMAPREKNAGEQMYRAEYQFKQDSFALALENPGGGFDGFLDIIDKYGGTKAANLANYYAGVCYLNLGRYEAAFEYLNDFNAKGDIMPISKYGAIADAQTELNQLDKAIKNYKKATSNPKNDYLTPYYLKKLGILLENTGENSEALKVYQKIKKEYPNSTEAQTIDRYIVKVS